MTTRATPSLLPWPHALVGVLGLLLVATSMIAMTGSGAVGAAPASDGSDWGPAGRLSSDSAVSVRWDNVGNQPESTVPRNQRQPLPHTDGRTYADITRSAQDAYAAHFGADNGYGGLRVTVSQTRGLLNQAVTVGFEGADPDLPGTGADSRTYFQVFQCWGATGADGTPDPRATSPAPETCQVGAPGPDTAQVSAQREYRVVTGDPLVRGGDWERYDSGFTEVPFRSITGEESGSNLDSRNVFFNRTTTNELSHVTLPASGATTREVELQTGAESRGLGCGARTDSPSTARCWLVVVPRVQGIHQQLGPISPSVWAQRLQVPLDFRDVQEGCPSGRARSLIGGSELLADAAASWTPGVCAAENIALGYSRYGDEVARRQYAAGASDAVLTSSPVTSGTGATTAVHVPVALAAPVVGLTVDYHIAMDCPGVQPAEVTSDAQAQECGYADLAALRADIARQELPIRDLRLDARLVAKLLTQSYQAANIHCESGGCVSQVNQGRLPAWTADRPLDLFADPEFVALNPQLHQWAGRGAADLVVEGLRSDAAATVWRWLLADPGAASFLNGCPDPWDVTINPFYSTRTYAGCQYRATALERAAAADRDASDPPRTYVDAPQSYPPLGSPYPLPGWQEVPAIPGRTARTLVDQFPRVDHMQAAGRNTFTGYRPRNNQWCATEVDSNCLPSPGKWKDPKTPQQTGLRIVLSLTDSATAARFRLPTAALCDEDGTACVGADTASLQAAAARFEPTGTTGVVGAATTADYAADAYPLALPVYAAVDPSLPAEARNAYATSLEYVVGRGQQPGFAAGDLPPGYAPLTPALRKQAATAITALRAGVPVAEPSESPDPTDDVEPTEDATTTAPAPTPTSPAAASSGALPAAPSASAPPSAAASPSTAASPGATTSEAAMAPAAAGTESWPGYTLALGLALALGAGIAGPVMRSRTRWRLR